MTIKQMVLAVMALGMIGNNVLAEETLPTLFFTFGPDYLTQNPNLSSDARAILHSKITRAKALHKTNDISTAMRAFYGYHLRQQACTNTEQSSQALTPNIRLYFMTDEGKNEVQNENFSCTTVNLDIYPFEPRSAEEMPNLSPKETQPVRIFYPKEMNGHDLKNTLDMHISCLQLDGATIEDVHNALNATIE